MTRSQSFAVKNRKEAALLLADKLCYLKNSNAIVVGASHVGAVLGYHLAKALHLAFDVAPCKKLGYPGNQKRTMGSISADEVIIHEEAHDIPRDYIYHQIILNQNVIKAQQAFFSGARKPLSVQRKSVVIVDDLLTSSDSVMALINSIHKQRPAEIIVVASGATREVVSNLSPVVTHVEVLRVNDMVTHGGFYQENTIIDDEVVRDLILKTFENLCRD